MIYAGVMKVMDRRDAVAGWPDDPAPAPRPIARSPDHLIFF
jgi:hypothetical protein